MVGTARSTLSFVVEPVELTLGFFSDETLEVESVLMLDGFDSTEGVYGSQLAGDQIQVDASTPYFMVDDKNHVMFYDGLFYRFLGIDGDTVTYDRTFTIDQALALEEQLALELDPTGELVLNFNGFVTEGEAGYDCWASDEYAAVVHHFDSFPYEVGSAEGGAPIVSDLGPTTGGGGLLASNGEVSFGDTEPVEVFGDVISGPQTPVQAKGDVTVTGEWRSRDEVIDLPPVKVPDISIGPGIVHDGLLPMLISPGASGFKSIEIAADAELVLRGPATVVIGELTLAPGASIELDTRAGDVSLFVTGGMDLPAGAFVTTPGSAPDELTIQVAPIPSTEDGAPVKLAATSQFYGTIYAPETEVRVDADFEVYGGIAARKLVVGAGARLHFDNRSYRGSPIPRIVSWKIVEVPARVRGNGDVLRELGLMLADLPPLVQAHDLESVTIQVTYLDDAGVERTFSGLESDLDWGQVAEVIQVERTTPYSPSLDVAGAGGAGEEPEVATGVRAMLQGCIDSALSRDMQPGTDGLFVAIAKLMAPLSGEEWTALEGMESRFDPDLFQSLRDHDISKGGTGGL